MYGLLTWPAALLLLIAGGGVGAILSRVYLLHWDDEKHEIAARIDQIGAVILVGYLVFSLARLQLSPLWGPEAPGAMASRLALTAGITVGRLVFLLAGIHALNSVVGVRLDR
jgi:hypothetical protein